MQLHLTLFNVPPFNVDDVIVSRTNQSGGMGSCLHKENLLKMVKPSYAAFVNMFVSRDGDIKWSGK